MHICIYQVWATVLDQLLRCHAIRKSLLYSGFICSKDCSSDSYYKNLWYVPGIFSHFFIISLEPSIFSYPFQSCKVISLAFYFVSYLM